MLRTWMIKGSFSNFDDFCNTLLCFLDICCYVESYSAAALAKSHHNVYKQNKIFRHELKLE